MFTSVYVHIRVCSHQCMFTSVYVQSVNVHISVCSHQCMFTSVYVHISICSHQGMFTSVNVHISVCSHQCMFTSVYVRKHLVLKVQLQIHLTKVLYIFLRKGKAIAVQAWTGPEGSRRLRLSDFMTIGA